MRLATILLFSLLLAGFWGCRNSDQGSQVQGSNNNSGTTIQTNKTVAIVQILKLSVVSETEWTARVVVTRLFQDDAYPSIAVLNGQYEVKPNFKLDEEKKITSNEDNDALMAFAKKKEGDLVRVEMFLSENGWFINKVIK